MTIQEVAELEVGTGVYEVDGINIRKLHLLSKHPKGYSYVYFIKDDSVTSTQCYYLKQELKTYFTLDYNDAKEKMWQNLQNKVRSINEIYMDGSKTVSFD